jgi:hypothetical protein
MKGKCLEPIKGAVVMTRSNVEELIVRPNRRFHWESFLPKRKAWIQTLILLPFSLPVANFLGASWNFSVNSIAEDHQYLIGTLSMVVNLILPSLFFACLFHWGWFIWKQESAVWYPRLPALRAGAAATIVIAISFGIIELLNDSLGVCSNPGWGSIGQTLLCNLDGYGFESKSWFGVWFIIAAYCYQAQETLKSLHRQIFDDRQEFLLPERANHPDFTSVNSIATIQGNLAQNDDFRIDPISAAAKSED